MSSVLTPEESSALRVGAAPEDSTEADHVELGSSDRLWRKKIPALQSTLMPLAETLRVMLGRELRSACKVVMGPMELLGPKALLEAASTWAAATEIRGAQLMGFLGVNAALGFTVIELAYGATLAQLGAAAPPTRPRLTEVERQTLAPIMQQLSGYLMGLLPRSPAGAELTASLLGYPLNLEAHGRMEAALLTTFTFSVGSLEACISALLMPHLLSHVEDTLGPSEDTMAAHLGNAQVCLSALLGKARVSLTTLAQLTPGEMVWLDCLQSDPIEVLVEGEVKFFGQPVACNGALGVAITARA